jgi:thymidylate synthase ThyX
MSDAPDAQPITFRSDVTVELVRAAAKDGDVLFAARVSTKGEQSLEDVDADASRSQGLINYLMRDRHGSPFEHNSMTFYVQAPIFVFREFMRHRVGYCLAGDSEVTFQSSSGLLRRDRISALHDRWHNGVTDRLPFVKGTGVTFHQKAGKWAAQVRSGGTNTYLGLYDTQEAAVAVVDVYREANPTLRRRMLPSIRQLAVRAYDEETLRPERSRILDVFESGVKPLVRITTETGLDLRCTAEHQVFTPDGWQSAANLKLGGHVMAAGRKGVPGESLVPPSLRRGIGVWTSMQRTKLIKPIDHCYVCRKTFPRSELVLDHRVPVAADLRLALDVANLAPCCKVCHRSKTNVEQALARRGGLTAAAVPARITSIRSDGKEMTYDLSVEGPWHNFLANGIVVHNSYNEESGRYRELRPVFYVPGPERKLVQEGKPGHYVFVDGTAEQYTVVDEETRRACTESYEAYQRMLDAGVAREVARGVLPVATYSSMYVTMNARSLMNFLSLRTKREDSHFPSFPQREIEMVAEQMEAYWAELMPLTYAAFNAAGRVAP